MTIREGLLTPGVGITLFHESLVETKTFPSTIIGDRKTLTLQNVSLIHGWLVLPRFRYFSTWSIQKKKKKKKENTALNSRDREIVWKSPESLYTPRSRLIDVSCFRHDLASSSLFLSFFTSRFVREEIVESMIYKQGISEIKSNIQRIIDRERVENT